MISERFTRVSAGILIVAGGLVTVVSRDLWPSGVALSSVGAWLLVAPLVAGLRGHADQPETSARQSEVRSQAVVTRGGQPQDGEPLRGSAPEPPTAKVPIRALATRDETSLMEWFKDIRKTPGARLIMAIWSYDYRVTVADYFKEEFEDLLGKAPVLEIRRAINRSRLDGHLLDEHDQALLAFYNDDHVAASRYHPTTTDIQNFECYACRYSEGGIDHTKALIVFVGEGKTPWGLYVDGKWGEREQSFAESVANWFLHTMRPAPQPISEEAIAQDERPA